MVQICLHFEQTVKGYQYGYQMKAVDVGVRNIQFVYLFCCLFTFHEYKHTNINNSQFREFATKPHEYEYQMKASSLKIKNMMYFYFFCCLFTFCKHKQTKLTSFYLSAV